MTTTRGNLVAARIYEVDQSGKEKGGGVSVDCMFNPFEYTVSKQNTYGENPKNNGDVPQVEFKKAVVTNVDTKRKVVVTETGEEPYDVLIITLGSHPAYFNIPGIRENSLTLGSFSEAQVVRARIYALLEKAEKTGKAPEIIVGGAGFTGIELTGELTGLR